MVDFLIKHPEIKSVMGNHEYAFIKSENYTQQEYSWWLGIGAFQTLSSYFEENKPFMEIPDDHWNYMENLPLYIEKNGVFITHSIILHSLEEATGNMGSTSSIVWARGGITKRVNKCFHVFGHTPVQKPMIKDYWANIDTGVMCYGTLSAIQYPSMQIFQQINIDI